MWKTKISLKVTKNEKYNLENLNGELLQFLYKLRFATMFYRIKNIKKKKEKYYTEWWQKIEENKKDKETYGILNKEYYSKDEIWYIGK